MSVSILIKRDHQLRILEVDIVTQNTARHIAIYTPKNVYVIVLDKI